VLLLLATRISGLRVPTNQLYDRGQHLTPFQGKDTQVCRSMTELNRFPTLF